MPVTTRVATVADAELVGSLTHDLIGTLGYLNDDDGRTKESFQATAARLLSEGTGFWSILAAAPDGRPAGILNLNQCAAIYAAGFFGEITELFAVPEFRGTGVGKQLIAHADRFGQERGWNHLEVGAPDVPRWQVTVDFYLSQKFETIGPRLHRDIVRAH